MDSLSQIHRSNYSDVVLPYLNWLTEPRSLEFTCEDTKLLSEQLKKMQPMAIGLIGEDTESDRNGAHYLLEDHGYSDQSFKYCLKSKCSTALLKRHCDKIVTSTALVKHRGERQLFLGTDFINWTDHVSGIEYQAPLILYPANLYYNDRRTGEQNSFILYCDTQLAIENKSLTEKLQSLTQVPFGKFSLNDQSAYLLKISQIVENHTALSLTTKAAVNILEIDTDHSGSLLVEPYRRFEDTRVNKDIALAVVENRSVEELRLILQLLSANRNSILSQNPTSKIFNPELKKITQALSSFGITDLSLQHVEKLPEKLEQWILAIENMRNTNFIKYWNKLGTKSFSIETNIEQFISLMDHPPSNTIEHYHVDHAYSTAVPGLQKAKFQYRLIQSELDSLKSVLNLEILPSYAKISSLCKVLDKNNSHNTDVVAAEYFGARKQVSNLLRSNSGNYSEQEEASIKRLLKILRVIELFNQNQEYKLILGPLFCGLDTDWNTLEKHIEFSQKITSILNSEIRAAFVLENWSSIIFTIQESVTVLREGARAVTKLMRLMQIPHNSDKSIDELIEMSQKIKPKIETLCATEIVDPVLKRLNPKTIVDSFGLIENIKIQLDLKDTKSSLSRYKEEVNTTIDWLEKVVAREHIRVQDINLLIDRL